MNRDRNGARRRHPIGAPRRPGNAGCARWARRPGNLLARRCVSYDPSCRRNGQDRPRRPWLARFRQRHGHPALRERRRLRSLEDRSVAPSQPDDRSPTVVAGDLAALVAAVPSPLPIHFQEVGYATAPACSSSDAAQSRFLCEVFAAWDAHTDRVPRLALLRLNDVTQAKARSLAGPYGTTAPAFTEYLRTLGLDDVTGQAKTGFQTVVEEATRRGF